MCRLYGQISTAPAGARDFLVDSERSLLRQSHFRPDQPQKDGWGVGYFIRDRARVVKSPGPIFQESRRFVSVASRVKSRAVIGHIRAASNPRGLPARRLLGPENTQPFTDGRIVFAHNGTLQIPDEVARFLGKYRNKLRGLNDSEVYFWQFMKFLDAHGSAPEALKACVRETWAIWERCKRRYPRRKAPYTGLNTLVSDGVSLTAMCHYPHGNEGQRSIFTPEQPWGAMSLRRERGRAVLASEDLDASGWERLRDSEIISCELRGGRLALRRARFSPR